MAKALSSASVGFGRGMHPRPNILDLSTSEPFNHPSIVRNLLLKHAVVTSVERVSRRYYLARLEVVERWFRTPGLTQFIMVWIPGIDCIPLSVAKHRVSAGRHVIEVLFDIRGDGTEALAGSEGSVVGVVGPLGRVLKLEPGGGPRLIVAGGSAVAAVARIAEFLARTSSKPTVVWGVRSGVDVGFVLERLGLSDTAELVLCSEDCSIGFCGMASDAALKLFRSARWEDVILAGPRQMLLTISTELLKEGVDPVVITESMVKCGTGLCGECVLPGGTALCRSGPAFRASEVLEHLRRCQA